MAALEAAVRERLASGDAASSHVARLAAGGPALLARKVGEEAVETVVAAMGADDAAVAAEAADLVFHLTVLLNARGLGWDAVAAELDRRAGTSGLAEKAARATDGE